MAWRSDDFYDYRPKLEDTSAEVKRALAELGKGGKGKGGVQRPVRPEGRKIAHTFWGEAWCRNLESYGDFANRLPRGRSYLRSGCVLHLAVEPGVVTALVRGTRVYRIEIRIQELPGARWKEITTACADRIDSLVDLLGGQLSHPVMEIVTRKDAGLFPSPREIRMTCSCPDWAALCKHLAAVLYGVGARLDEEPSLLFTLRKVDAGELVAKVAAESATAFGTERGAAIPGATRLSLPREDLSRLFGIDLGEEPPAPLPPLKDRARKSGNFYKK